MESGALIHRRLGHRCLRDLVTGLNNVVVTGTAKIKNEHNPLCEVCFKGKSNCKSISNFSKNNIQNTNFYGKMSKPLSTEIRKVVKTVKDIYKYLTKGYKIYVCLLHGIKGASSTNSNQITKRDEKTRMSTICIQCR